MRLTIKQLKQLSVQTISGMVLGHVHDVIFEIEGQLVAQYIVRPSLVSRNEYVINRDQVVRFEAERLLVDDSVSAASAPADDVKGIGVSPNPIAMRDLPPPARS